MCQSQECNLLLQKSGPKSCPWRGHTRRRGAAIRVVADTRNSVAAVTVSDYAAAACGGRSVLLHQRTVCAFRK